MAHQFTLPEEAKIVGSLPPAADAAGRTGRWINAGYAEKVYIIFHLNQGVATAVPLSINQATSVGGAGSKALIKNARIWANEDVAGNPDNLQRQTDGVSYTPAANIKEKTVVFEIDPASLDIPNSFFWVAGITGASSASNITECTVYAVPMRYPSQAPGINIAQ